jgi:hypothetical protein
VILGAFRSSDLGADVRVSSVPVAAAEVRRHFVRQLFHVLAGVVAGDVIVQVFPHTLDAVVVRAVWRQEVQAYPAACRRQRQLSALAVVNLVVVQDHMNALGLRILL